VSILARPADVSVSGEAAVIASWNEDETVTVQAGYDAREGIAAQIKKKLSLVRPPYTIEVTEAKDINYKYVTLTVVTDAPEFSIELKTSDGTLVGSLTGTMGSDDYKVPLEYNLGSTDRIITATNKYKSDPALKSFDQPSSPLVDIYGPYASDRTRKCPTGYTNGKTNHIYKGVMYDGALADGQFLMMSGATTIYLERVHGGTMSVQTSSNPTYVTMGQLVYNLCERQ
jgi:hypothetical protein